MKKPVIMVVDDDESLRKLLAIWLEEVEDHETIVFEDGETAWQFMKKYGFLVDLMMTDLYMPEVTGMELTRAVKRLFPEVKIIMMTAMHDMEGQAMETGVDIFLKKPFKLEQLQKAVNELLP